MKDAVIIGGGLAGLSAAWRLRHWDIQVLEGADRVGGRIRSEKRGVYHLNWGGHMFAGAGSSTAELLAETGTRSGKIPGSLKGMAMNGKFVTKGRVETYPFRIPMSLGARMALLLAGARVGADVLRYSRAVRRRLGETGEARQQRVYDFENDRTFAQYLGRLPSDAEAFFRPTVTRSAAEPDELSAGAGIGYFSLIWNVGEGLDRAILGGPSTLTEGIAQTMRDRLELGAQVREVVQNADHVVVRYSQDGIARELKARTAVLATPAPVSHEIAVNLPDDIREALSQIVYGPLVSGAFLTNETSSQRYDGTYGIAVAKKSFNVALNQASIVRGRELERSPGGSIMTFSPASLARTLMEQSDSEIIEAYTRDMDSIFPGFAGIIDEAHIARWPLGAPYCFPGRGNLQSRLTRPSERIFLAGDYLGTLYTETAISSGFTAAQEAASLLSTLRQRGSASRHTTRSTRQKEPA